MGLLIAIGVNAQNSPKLKGPQAKNARLYETTKSTKVATRSVPLKMRSPKAKNHLRQGLKSGEGYTYVSSSPRMFLKGPAAKHYRPKINAFNSNVFRQRGSEE